MLLMGKVMTTMTMMMNLIAKMRWSVRKRVQHLMAVVTLKMRVTTIPLAGELCKMSFRDHHDDIYAAM